MEESGKWVPLEDLTDWEHYKRLVRKDTEKTYIEHKDIINPDNYDRVLCGEDGHQLDHIIGVHEGFTSNIPIYMITNKENLQMLTWKDNRDKW